MFESKFSSSGWRGSVFLEANWWSMNHATVWSPLYSWGWSRDVIATWVIGFNTLLLFEGGRGGGIVSATAL